MRDPRYDILFEPVKIGPVTAKNRFYQVPHCTGMGWLRPQTLATMRGIKAEGGWGVVNTEYCSIHPTSDDLPFPYASLWDEADVKANALMTEAVHAHGALAGVELWHGGSRSDNLYTREVGMDIASLPITNGYPAQSRAMDKEDIKNVRQWHRDAALRAKAAEFDIVYVYATHGYLLSNFLRADVNSRTDEYGGSVENRTRLIKELVEETKEAVGDKCAVAVRFSIDDGGGPDGTPVQKESREIFSILAELPDLWDVSVRDYSFEMGVSRFVKQAALEPYVSFVKAATTKPVVTVGRFTSPDTMASQIKRGIVDFIGAARPSIADPFLPKKIEEGRVDEIRECIGCNICYSGDGQGVPIRCTQNPTIGEEWRRGWHPEKIESRQSDSKVLVVGGGPAGLETALALGQRGYSVMLSEAQNELGGRVNKESRLPGLSEWGRVRDYRVQKLLTMPKVDIFMESKLTPKDILMTEADHIAIATGSNWRADGLGRSNLIGIKELTAKSQIFTPDNIMNGNLPTGKVTLFDDDSYYMGAVLAELLTSNGCSVTYVTPDNCVGSFTSYTSEQARTQTRLMDLGVELVLAHNLLAFDGTTTLLSCSYSGREKPLSTDALVLVTARLPNDELFYETQELIGQSDNTVKSLKRIGDCFAPGIIATAVYAGHKYARELDGPDNYHLTVKRDQVVQI